MEIRVNDSGSTFLALLAVAFIVLKLANVISWSWWWVLLPVYGPIVLVFGGMLIGFILLAIADLIER